MYLASRFNQKLLIMITATDIKEDIRQQVDIGFGKREIIDNLRTKGYSDEEIKDGLNGINFSAAAATGSGGGSVSGGSIALGILFLIVAMWRLARAANNGSGILIIGVITAIGMAIYFFTKRR
jgi:hypothetical protein